MKLDNRYSINKTLSPQLKARYTLTFCGDYINTYTTYQDAHRACVLTEARRMMPYNPAYYESNGVV